MRTSANSRAAPDWSQILTDAVNTPGTLSSAYRRFWNYSVGNQLLAHFECLQRELPLGPIHTFKGWLDLGRQVNKGEKAITLCMPVMVKQKSKSPEPAPDTGADVSASGDDAKRTIFVYKSRWFVLSQTEGAPYIPTEVPEWSESRALGTLRIERIEFHHLDGNCQGFAQNRHVAISPIAALPHKTLFHECAHVVLGHTNEGMFDDHERTPVNLREVEAECVALICCESLDLPGVPECRGYIQHWLRQTHETPQPIPQLSAQPHLPAPADVILKAGRAVTASDSLT